MEFYYFGIRFWRGDVARILIHLGNLDIKDNALGPEDFGKLLEEGKLPFKQVPIIVTETGETVTQAVAIAKLLASKAGYYPTDLIKAAKVDELVLIVEEMSSFIFSTEKLPAEEKEAARKKVIETVIATNCANLDRLIGSKKYASGDELTLADIIIWTFFNFFAGDNMKHFPADYHTKFGNLNRVYETVGQHEGVAKWVATQKLGRFSV